jgi:hypothetical protein
VYENFKACWINPQSKMKILIKPIIFLLIVCPTLLFAQTISVTNESSIARKDVLITIPWEQIASKFANSKPGEFKLVQSGTNKECAFQTEYLGQSEIQNLLIQVSVEANSTIKLTLKKGKPTALTPKTFARYVPERLDDFAWENDKIAFRAYGKALEGTKGDAYGFDVWSKRTDKLIIDTRYKHGDYHHDLGDGLDYYHVGLTLGAGNIAPFHDNTIVYSKNYHNYKVLDNGPLRSTFELAYDAWQVGDKSVTATKRISIDAGSQMNKIEVKYNYDNDGDLPIVIGIIKRPEQGHISIDEIEGTTTYWEPQHGNDGTSGVAVVSSSPVTATAITKDQILTHTNYKKSSPFVYYMGAAWDKAGEITNASDWINYVKDFKNQLKTPLLIKIN